MICWVSPNIPKLWSTSYRSRLCVRIEDGLTIINYEWHASEKQVIFICFFMII